MDFALGKLSRSRRRHHLFRKRHRAFEIIGDWDEALREANNHAGCPGWCFWCANPRRTRQGKAALTRAELKVLDSFREQVREHLTRDERGGAA